MEKIAIAIHKSVAIAMHSVRDFANGKSMPSTATARVREEKAIASECHSDNYYHSPVRDASEFNACLT